MKLAARLWRLLPEGGRRALLALGVLSLLSSLAELATFAALAAFLHTVVGGDGAVLDVALRFTFFAIGAAAIRWWLQVTTSALASDVAHTLSVEAKRRLLGQPVAFHHGYHSAHAAALLEKVRALSGAALLPLVRLVQSALIAGGIVAASIWALPPLALSALAGLGLLYIVVARLAVAATRRSEKGLASQFDARARIVQESFTGIRDVLLDGLAEARVEAFARVDSSIQRRIAHFQSLSAAPRILAEGLGMALLALLVALLVARDGSAALAAIGLTAFAAQRLLPLAHAAYAGWQGWTANRGMIDDVAAVLELPMSVERTGPSLPFESEVELRRASFAYVETSVLDQVDVRLARGERVGLAGDTGAGKSTLADLLMGLLPPNEGDLVVDGSRVPPGKLGPWQRNIAHVGQQLFLLDATVAENIAFGRPIDRERLVQALHLASLDELLPRLADPVGEAGVRLSGGQRQRLALARAHYKGAPFWVLDEATSALDAATEDRVLGNLPDGATVLIISHRPAALAHCDRVYCLANGRVSGG